MLHHSTNKRHGRIRWDAARTLAAWIYAGLLSLWWVLRVSFGDQIWWLALVSVFAPYLFAPLLFLAPLGLIRPRLRYWGALLLAGAILLLEYGPPMSVWAAAPSGTGDELTVLSFNAWGYSDSIETAQAIVSQGTPDVVVLQELSPQLAQTLVEELGAAYPYRVFKTDQGTKSGGVLSRYPLAPAGYVGSGPQYPFAQVVEATVDDQVFTIYNVHLDATVPFHYYPSVESFAQGVRSSFAARERQVEQLVADLERRQGPAIVAGDFNMTSQSDAYATLAQYLSDAHRAAGRGFGHTFPAYRGRWGGVPIPARLVRIDMILYSPDWTAREFQVLSEHGQSDHLPVLARLTWSQ